MTIRQAFAAVALIGLLALSGCASARQDRIRGEPDALTIALSNNVSSITLYLVPRTGTRALLGTIRPTDRGMLVYRGARPLEEYRLVALNSNGADLRSEWFRPYSRGTVVRWDLSSNRLLVWAADRPDGG